MIGEIKGYSYEDKFYHPECLPVNTGSQLRFVVPLRSRVYGIGRQRCARCSGSLFPREKVRKDTAQTR